MPELFEEASALDEHGRQRLLERLRAESPAVAEELSRLLAADAAAPSPIDLPPTLPFRDLRESDHDVDERPAPERVGPYRIVREIGRGGMGRVFLAEQETPDFTRTVALKLIDGPTPWGDAVRRFRDEVRILASLNHPGIVRFLDGGRTPEGTWFLALEYVEGEDLVAHSTRNGLDVEARTRLVLEVTEAVAYAHQRGVIHRDLKPSNVMVGRDGRPRLLDFGISKLLDASSDVSQMTTAHGMRPLTPAYASPEQLALEDATPASDVYSLGVILYELVAGKRPKTGGSPTGEPEPPSTAGRRRSSASGGGGSSTAPPMLGTTFRRRARDLDAICLRALRRDPQARYANAGELAADLRRFVDGQAVLARERGGWLRRNVPRSALAVVAGAALALLGVGAFVYWSRYRAEADASGGRKALAANVAPAVIGRFPLDPINPPPVEESEKKFAEAPTNLVAGAELVIGLARADRLDEARIAVARLRQVPGAELDPLVDFADAYIAISAGEEQRSQVFLMRARDNAIAHGRWDLVGTLRFTLGSTLKRLGQRDAAQRELDEAQKLLARAGDYRPLYRCLINLASLKYERGELDACETLYKQALGVARQADIPPLIALTNLAEIQMFRGRPDLAEVSAREPLPELRGHPNAARGADALTGLAQIVEDLGRSREAEAYLAEAIAHVEGAHQPASLAAALLARSRIDLEHGRLDRIDATVKQLEKLAVEDASRRPLAMARSLAAEKAALVGDLASARPAFDEARRLLIADGFRYLAALSDISLAEADLREGSPAAAAQVLAAALAGFDEASSITPRFFAETLLARIDAAAGRPQDARRRLAALGEGLDRSPSHSRRLAYLRARAAISSAEGRADNARRDLAAALDLAIADGRKRTELELRLDRAALGHAADEAAAVKRDATALGLLAIARRAS